MTDEVASRRSAHWGLWATLLWGAAIAMIFVALQIAVVLTGVEFGVDAGEAQLEEQLVCDEPRRHDRDRYCRLNVTGGLRVSRAFSMNAIGYPALLQGHVSEPT